MSRNKHISIKDLDRIDLQTLPEDGGDEYNRLIFEKSPYLLQHATNPIDWNPWADSTLDRARKLNRPIFLSIGYSTCHWCHVMADESFTDTTVARILNEQFIPIKVDREERPDIDATYMQACQAMTGSGGWPLTLLLTPTLQPFFAATYLPKDNRPGLLGLVSLLEKIVDLWQTDRARIDLAGSSIQQTLTQTDNQPGSREPLTEDIFRQAVNTYRSRYDQIHGGFSPAPKFPAPHNLSLLFRLQHRLADKTVGDMALHSLNSI
ncbi:MAG: thioredoxin domain-containing protein, partial [Desulfuromonas sp.]